MKKIWIILLSVIAIPLLFIGILDLALAIDEVDQVMFVTVKHVNGMPDVVSILFIITGAVLIIVFSILIALQSAKDKKTNTEEIKETKVNSEVKTR